MSQFKDWEDFIHQLEDKKACVKELKKVKECGNFKNFFKHENINDWIKWIIINCLTCSWPEAEPVILTDASSSCRYAYYVLKRPWPEAEPIILTDAWSSYHYARDFLKRPWPEAEPIILGNVWLSYFYARDVLKRPWPEAEPVIMKDAEAWDGYSSWKKEIKHENNN